MAERMTDEQLEELLSEGIAELYDLEKGETVELSSDGLKKIGIQL